jgi:hypothetical protein
MTSPLVVQVDWGDVVTTTLENRSNTIADNITNNNALLSRLRKKGKEKTFSGGREIMQELRYAQNQTFMWYSGYEYINVSLNDTMTAARFPIKQASIAVTISGLEELQNSSVEQMKDLIEERVDTAEDTFWNQMSAGIYSDGTGWGGKQINGLAAAVSLTPTVGIYGGIDRSVQAWWRNQSVNIGTLPTTTTIQAYMNSMAISLKRNSDGADLIVADNNYYLAYLESLQAIQRVTSDGDEGGVGAGFTSLKYFGAGKSVDVVLDGGRNGQIRTIGATNGTMIFLNTDYIFFRPHSGRNFKVIGGDRVNVNQDAKVRIMAWAGNMTCNNASLQGVLYN